MLTHSRRDRLNIIMLNFEYLHPEDLLGDLEMHPWSSIITEEGNGRLIPSQVPCLPVHVSFFRHTIVLVPTYLCPS